jgi:hypothetical protein
VPRLPRSFPNVTLFPALEAVKKYSERLSMDRQSFGFFGDGSDEAVAKRPDTCEDGLSSPSGPRVAQMNFFS